MTVARPRDSLALGAEAIRTLRSRQRAALENPAESPCRRDLESIAWSYASEERAQVEAALGALQGLMAVRQKTVPVTVRPGDAGEAMVVETAMGDDVSGLDVAVAVRDELGGRTSYARSVAARGGARR